MRGETSLENLILKIHEYNHLVGVLKCPFGSSSKLNSFSCGFTITRVCTHEYMHTRACIPPPTLAAVYLQLGPSLFVSTGRIYSGSTTSCPQLPGTQVTASHKLSALDLCSLGLFPTARPQKWIPCLGWPRGTNSVPYVRILIPHSHARVLSISAAVVSPAKNL